MKTKIFFFLLNMTILSSAFSQDVLILNTKEKIEAKVAEIGVNEIKYRKWENLGGPIYSVLKSDVFMIMYENGSQESFDSEKPNSGDVAKSPNNLADMMVPTSRYKLSSVNANKLKQINVANYNDYSRARTGKTVFGVIGGISTLLCLATLANGLINFDANNTSSKVVTPPTVGFAVVAVVANILQSGPKRKIKRAYNNHNEEVGRKMNINL